MLKAFRYMRGKLNLGVREVHSLSKLPLLKPNENFDIILRKLSPGGSQGADHV